MTDEFPDDPRHVAKLTVIDEALMLRAARREVRQGDKDAERGKRRAEEIADAAEAKELILSFQNVAEIGGLVGMEQLEKLCLDNNYIRAIENLSHLRNLRWLDLSFNRIKHIEGLDALANLTDLSLFSNRIRTIQNLNGLSKLECLSVGNNQISGSESVSYLQQFPNLKSLCLRGNPLAEDPEYTSNVIANLPQLVFLDFKLIVEHQREEAKMAFQDLVQEIAEKEAQERALEEQQALKRQAEGELQKAHMSFLSTLFEDMFEKDKEKHKISKLPGQPDLRDECGRAF